MEIVSMPFELAVPALPMIAQPWPTHRVLDISRVQRDLGYHDLVPARQAVRRAARWLAEHPPQPGGTEERVLTDPFDYAAEDALIAAWAQCLAGMPTIENVGRPPPRWTSTSTRGALSPTCARLATRATDTISPP
jgi:hypothetical protein